MPSALINRNWYNLLIGNRAAGNKVVTGDMDDIMIFNRTLSADEVHRLYNNGAGTEIF